MRNRLSLGGLVAAVLLGLAPGRAHAGGGPETTVIVVNARSPSSIRVANEYVRRRGIPASHVIPLYEVPQLAVIGIDDFRTKLWAPVKAHLEKLGILDRADVIAWSTEMPYGVDFTADKKLAGTPPMTPTASLTAMTFFARKVEAKDADGYLDPYGNRYYRRAPGETGTGPRAPTEAEQAAYREASKALIDKDWATAAEAYARLLSTYGDDPVQHYNYACCLARLGKAPEALAALTRAVEKGFSEAEATAKDPDLEPLRGKPEFEALLAKMAAAAAAAAAATSGDGVTPAHGFRASSAWTGAALPTDDPTALKDSTDRYFLSTLLGYTGPWGNSIPEVLSCLERAAESDGKNPDGTFYFLKNGDVRSTTREPRFELAIRALEALGRKAVVLSKDDPGQTGILPVGKADVLGACVGTAGFDWAASKSTLVPGAIAEHLTSHGGQFDHGGQTKCSAWIRAGAAGSSGTVYEPYSVQWKFPVPHIHAHYVEGCSLAEAFYQSVAGPYQLVILGDPLTRPFAKLGRIALEAGTAPLAGTVSFTPSVTPAEGRPVGKVELWVDGIPAGEAAPGAPLAWDTTTVEDGAHEVRVVAVESDRIETRTGTTVAVTVANGGTLPTLVVPKTVAFDGTFPWSGRAPGATKVELLRGAWKLAEADVKGDAFRGSLPVSEAGLGLGAVTLQVRAIRAKGPATRSAFATVTVEPPALRKAIKSANGKPGWHVTLTPATGKPLELVLPSLGGPGQEAPRKGIEAKTKEALKEVLVEGEVEVKEAGLYQLLVNAGGRFALEVDGKPVGAASELGAAVQAHFLTHLDAGWHLVRMRLAPKGAPELTVLLGGDRVTAPLAGEGVRQAAGGRK